MNAAIKAVNNPLVPMNAVKNPPSLAGSAAMSKKPTIEANIVEMKFIWLVAGRSRFIESVKALAVVPPTKKAKMPIE